MLAEVRLARCVVDLAYILLDALWQFFWFRCSRPHTRTHLVISEFPIGPSKPFRLCSGGL